MNVTARDWGMLIALALMWGTAFLATRVAVAAVPPATVVAARLTIAVLVLLGLLRLTGLRLPRGRVWGQYAALGFFGTALPFQVITWGQARIDSGLASILLAVMPIVTLLLAARWIEEERLTPRRVGGFVVGFVGLVVLVGPEAVMAIGGDPALMARQGAVLVGALSYAVNAILARYAPAEHVLVNTAGMLIAGCAMIMPVALCFDRPWAWSLDGAAAASIVWLGLVSTAAASVVYLEVVRSAGPAFFSLINYLIPIVGVGAGAVVLDERVGTRALVALAVILAGVALSQREA